MEVAAFQICNAETDDAVTNRSLLPSNLNHFEGDASSSAFGDVYRGTEILIPLDEISILPAAGVEVDFRAVMQRMRQRRATLARNDSAERLTGLGIHLFFGDAAFTSAREIVVGSELRP